MTAPRPDIPAADRELEQRWRMHSNELPRPHVDDAIRAAARRARRRRPIWQRYAPLAAAASVCVIALLLLRLSPTPSVVSMPVISEPAAHERRAAESTATADLAAAPADTAAVAEARPSAPPREPASPSMRAESTADAEATDAASEKTVAAGAAAPSAATPSAAVPSPALERAAVATQSPQASDALPPHLAALVKADAAKRAGANIDQVTIVFAQSVTWSDGALGCRTPGEIAIQVLTPGYRVDVEAAGKRLRYHTDTREQIRVCARFGSPR